MDSPSQNYNKAALVYSSKYPGIRVTFLSFGLKMEPADVSRRRAIIRKVSYKMIRDRLLRRLTQIPGARSLWSKFPYGSVDTRVQYGIFDRPHYAYGVYSAADLAKRLGVTTISVIEFGVAGGRGLLALENIATAVADHFRIQIHVCGFDTGEGMPEASDYRDLPHVWTKGYYKMDVPKLKAQLSSRTELVLGDIGDTVTKWSPRGSIGFVSFDIDYYSSTKKALRLFDSDAAGSRLPRVYCYFDDLFYPENACHNEYVGELCAIREFNEEHEYKKVCPIHRLDHVRVSAQPWNDQMYVMHDFQHPLYCQNLVPADEHHSQLPL
jgi:hypothetical protein